MGSIESGFVDEKKEEGSEQPMRAGRLARTAMATLLLLGGAVDRMAAQTQGAGVEKGGDRKEQVVNGVRMNDKESV